MMKRAFRDIKKRLYLEWRPLLYIAVSLIFLTALLLFYPVSISMPCSRTDWLISSAFLIIILPFGILFYKALKKENVWCSYSWAYYFFGVLAFIPLSYYKADLKLFIIIWLSLCISLLRFLRWKVSKIKFNEKWIFTPDSVSKNDDKFDFKISSEQIAEKIIKDDSVLNVYLLDGSQGYGKSSYARMVVESLGNPQDVLYTYVSLTETNEENDLSKLFEERWETTLEERYPKICSGCLDGIADIIRIPETRLSLKDLFGIFKYIDLPINKTKAIGNNLESKVVKDCSEKNARLFRCVPKIYEKVWAIVFDEVDRALPKEIYRLIEIVERFKYLEDGGFPVKLRFFICVSRDKLYDLLTEVKETDDRPLAGLIDDFFGFAKSPDSILVLPTVPFVKRREFIRALLKDIYNYNNDEGLYENTKDFIRRTPDPTQQWLNPVESLQFAINLLANATPRVAKKCINSAFSFSKSFFNKRDVEYRSNIIRFSDLILMEYIKIKYSFLFDFMNQTIEELLSMQKRSIFQMNFIDKQKVSQRISAASGETVISRNPKEILHDWVKEVCPNAKEEDLAISIQILSSVAFCYIEYCAVNFQQSLAEDSLSYKRNLDEYLRLSSVNNKYERFDKLYLEHKATKGADIGIFERLVTSQDLIDYALTICRIKDASVVVLLNTAKELWRRLKSNEIKFVKHEYSGVSLRKDAVLRIPLLLYLVLEDKLRNIDKDNEGQEAIELFIDILKSSEVEVGLKIALLEYIKSTDVIGKPFSHEMLILFYQDLLKTKYAEKIKAAYKYVFEEFDKKYIDDGKNIYESEEDVFYVLFHIWSGRVDKEKINKIHDVVQKGLDANFEVIQQLWKLLTDENGAKPLPGQHILAPNLNSVALYIQLDKLIEITKKVIKDDRELLQKASYYEKLLGAGKANDLLVVSENKATLRRFIDDLSK